MCSTSSMSIGLQGVKDSDVEKVRETIKTVIEQVKQEGFDPKRIEAAIHQMELGQKHVSFSFFKKNELHTQKVSYLIYVHI